MADTKPNGEKPDVIELEGEVLNTQDNRVEDDRIEDDQLDRDRVEPGFSRDADTVLDQSARRSVASLVPWIAGAGILGLVGGGWLYRDVLAQYFPDNQITALSQRVDAMQAENTSAQTAVANVNALAQKLSTNIESLEAASQQLKSELDALKLTATGATEKQAAAEQSLAEMSSSIASLKQTLSTISSTTGSASPVDQQALVTLSGRVDVLEKDFGALKSQKSAAPDMTVLSQSLADMKAKIATGASFATELDRVQRMVPAAEGLDVLARNEQGLPNAQGLAAELKAAIPTLPASTAPASTEDDGYWSRFSNFVSGLITIRDAAEKDWPKFAESLVATAETGNLADAITAVDEIDGSKPGAIAQFRDRAAARVALEAALTKTSEAITREITARAATP
jgi:predicted  nucleic acid-binding Zn-ribbon protein